MLLAALVAILSAIPLALAELRFGSLVQVFYPDEAYYATRVLDAARGGLLGNPYLAGHGNSPRYLPELTERSLAFASRAVGDSPLTVLAASRVAIPVLLVLALAALARSIGIETRLAALAASSVAILPPILTLVQPAGTGQHGFLRLFRIVSPGCHMLLTVLALAAVAAAWKRATVPAGVGAGLAISILFLTPVYYWAFAAAGTALLALAERGAVRRSLAAALLTAGILSIPFGLRQAALLHSAEVRATLARLGLMIPGRGFEREVPRRFVENFAALAAVWLFRKRIGRALRFLGAFLLAADLLLVQNVVTNRQVQAFHWMHCLFLVWPLAGAAIAQTFEAGRRRFWVGSAAAVLALSAALAQAIAFANWEELRSGDPALYTLDLAMPETLSWLNGHTPPGSVVLAPESVMASLPIFTRNRVYWAFYAGQYALSDREVDERREDAEAWNRRESVRLRYRADYGIRLGNGCRAPGAPGLMFRSRSEGACVVRLAQ